MALSYIHIPELSRIGLSEFVGPAAGCREAAPPSLALRCGTGKPGKPLEWKEASGALSGLPVNTHNNKHNQIVKTEYSREQQ